MTATALPGWANKWLTDAIAAGAIADVDALNHKPLLTRGHEQGEHSPCLRPLSYTQDHAPAAWRGRDDADPLAELQAAEAAIALADASPWCRSQLNEYLDGQMAECVRGRRAWLGKPVATRTKERRHHDQRVARAVGQGEFGGWGWQP